MARIASINPAIGIPVGCIAMVCVAAFTVLVVLFPVLLFPVVLFSVGLLLFGVCALTVIDGSTFVFWFAVKDVIVGIIV